MPIVFRCSECDTLIRSTENADAKEGTCTQCGAVTPITETIAEWSDSEDVETRREIQREEGSEPEVEVPDYSVGRDFWIPLGMIVAAVAARFITYGIVLSRNIDTQGYETTAFVLILSFIAAVSVAEGTVKISFTVALGLVAMMLQSLTLGTPFGSLRTAILKVSALMLFTPMLVCVGLLTLVIWFDEPQAFIGSLLLLPVFALTFFVLTKWFFDMEIFEAIVFASIVLVGPIMMSLTAEWAINHGPEYYDSFREFIGELRS